MENLRLELAVLGFEQMKSWTRKTLGYTLQILESKSFDFQDEDVYSCTL